MKPLTPTQAREVTLWWTSLPPEERRRLGDLRAPRAPREDRSVVVARFVEAADDEDPREELYDYLVAHELALVERTFHICSAETAAREAIAEGRIPAGFVCPRASASCPMRALLDAAPGCDVVFLGARR